MCLVKLKYLVHFDCFHNHNRDREISTAHTEAERNQSQIKTEN